MAINGAIPNPNLEFEEGKFAVITVINKLNMETSIHWHGVIWPNFYDGVCYMKCTIYQTGRNLPYKFAIQQSGTHWYHSNPG